MPKADVRSKIIRLSIYYFFVTLTYSSFSSVIIYLHQKYKHKGFGEAYLTANSLASVIIYMFCPLILSRLTFSSTKLLTLCTMGYFINVFLPSVFALFDSADGKSPPTHLRFGFEILGNLLGGGASGIFMVINGRYMTEICKNVPEKGYYFGIANAIMNARLVVAPLVTMLGLGLGNEAFYFMLLSGIILASLPFPLILIPAIKLNSSSSENSSNESISEDSTSLSKNLISYFKYFKEFKYIIPSLILAGSMAGFVSSSISHLLPKASKGENNDNLLGFVLVWVGLGNVVGGYISGWLADKVSMKVSSFVGHSVLAITSVLTCFYFTLNPFLWGTCIIGFLSGYSFSHLFSLISLMCTVYFKGSSESFSVSKQVPILSYISYQWLVAFLNNTCNMNFNMKYQSIFMVLPAAIGMYCMNKSCDEKDKNLEEINQQNMSTVDNIESETPKLSNEIMIEEA